MTRILTELALQSTYNLVPSHKDNEHKNIFPTFHEEMFINLLMLFIILLVLVIY